MYSTSICATMLLLRSILKQNLMIATYIIMVKFNRILNMLVINFEYLYIF